MRRATLSPTAAGQGGVREGSPSARRGEARSRCLGGKSRDVVAQSMDQRVDALRVEGGAGLGAEERERVVHRPGGTVDARRDESVVDVAQSQDPSLEIELVCLQAARVAAPVESLVMV